MGKMVEIQLQSLTCEFAGDDGDNLEVTGRLEVHGFNDPTAPVNTQVLLDFPGGALTLRKGESAAIGRAVRVAMPTTGDPVGMGVQGLRFGGQLIEADTAPDTHDALGEQWQTLDNVDILNAEPRVWHLYFGRNEQVVRADVSVHIAHPL